MYIRLEQYRFPISETSAIGEAHDRTRKASTTEVFHCGSLINLLVLLVSGVNAQLIIDHITLSYFSLKSRPAPG